MRIEPFFDPATYTLTFVVWDPQSRDAVVIDPVLDFDPASGRTSTASADKVSGFVHQNDLKVHWILETHAHADHLSASRVLKERHGAGIAIGEQITEVQQVFKGVFGLDADFPVDGRQFDKLIAADEIIEAGALQIRAIHTPGHTPACMSFLVGDAVFTGDALFLDDYGTGRCDFPAGSADALYTSVHDTLYSLPDETRVFVGHDYQPGGRAVAWETTIGASKARNPQLTAETTREDFVRFRTERDAGLGAPRLLWPAVQVNIRAGALPEPNEAGQVFLRIPVRPSLSPAG